MTIEEMKARKVELGYTNQTLADLAGIPVGTLQKIFSGATKAPRRDTILALEKILGTPDQKQQEKEQSSPYLRKHTEAGVLKESTAVYRVGREEGYTLEDYLALPDERRVELIDGVFYDMAAPTTIHQAISGFIHKMLLDYVLEHGGKCMPFMSPVDVQLDQDDRTLVQPDVMLVCDRSKFQNGRVFGAPDFLVEVLSPSTRKKDMQLKLYKYGDAGVREYWMVDPEKRVTIVYDLEHMGFPVIYGEHEKVPVVIWNGECTIDFETIYQHIQFLYEN